MIAATARYAPSERHKSENTKSSRCSRPRGYEWLPPVGRNSASLKQHTYNTRRAPDLAVLTWQPRVCKQQGYIDPTVSQVEVARSCDLLPKT